VPSHEHPVIACVAVVRRGADVLVGRRHDGALAGRLEFPGGKLAPGESPEECVRREVREEAGLELAFVRPVTFAHHRYPDRTVLLLVFEGADGGGAPAGGFRFVPLESLNPSDMPEANAEVLGRLKRRS